jgi:uncharacterized protein (DUF2236 family)
MDRTTINLASLLLGGAGVFAVLFEYNVPELRKSYWNESPFAVKAEIIRSTRSWFFIALAVVATAIQASAEIWSDRVAERSYGATGVSPILGPLVMTGAPA